MRTETRLSGLFKEGIRKVIHKLICIVDSVGELANDPNDRSFRLRLVELVEMLAELGNDAFVLPWISTEDVFDDDDSFLDDIRHFGLDEL